MTLSNLSSQHTKESDVSVDTGYQCFETSYNQNQCETCTIDQYVTGSSDSNEDDETDVVEELPKVMRQH
jgi:hypothetical protein